MSKKLSRILFIVSIFIVGILLLGQRSFAATGFVTTSGRNLTLNGSTFKSIGVNRYNLMTLGGTPFVGCGGTFTDSELTTWFSELHDMGVTSVRFWLFQQFTSGGTNLSRLNTLLSLAQQYDVKLIPVFENQWSDCTQGGQKTSTWYQSGYKAPYGSYTLSLKDYIGKIVPAYANNPNILMWQIMNEAEDSDTAGFYNFAKDVSGYIKSLDSNHLVSFGTMGSGQPGSSVYTQIHSLPSVDVLEYHDYNSVATALPSTLQDRINDSISLNKPLIVGEAGINMNDGYSAADRASYFSNKIAAYFSNNGSDYMIWSYREANAQDAGYEFNFTDPLVNVIKGYTKDFNSGTPAVTNAPTQAPVATINPTLAPTSIPSPTPTVTAGTTLGGLNLSGYSRSLGYGPNVKLVNGVWVFSRNGSAIDMTAACQWQYKTDNVTAVQTQPGNPYSWACFTGQTSVTQSQATPVTPQPTAGPTLTPTAIPVQTATSTVKLGGLNLSGYSESLGYGQNVSLVNNNWVFSSNGKTIDMNAACQWQYHTASATAVQTVSGNPYSWACYGN